MRMDPSRRDQSRRLHLLVACVAMVFLLIVLAASPGIAQEGSRLEKIDVVGLKRLTQEQAVTSSGLQLGQTVDRQILQAAVDKMMKSRLYSNVGYRFRAEDRSQDEARLFEVEPGSRVLALCRWQTNRSEHATLVMWHGMEGSTASAYMMTTANKAFQAGLNVVRVNVRNCGETENLSP